MPFADLKRKEGGESCLAFTNPEANKNHLTGLPALKRLKDLSGLLCEAPLLFFSFYLLTEKWFINLPGSIATNTQQCKAVD